MADYNSSYTGAQIDGAIHDVATKLPAPGSSAIDGLLMYNKYDESYGWMQPHASSHNSGFIYGNASTNNIEWIDGSLVPPVSSQGDDEGKVLKVDNGDITWAEILPEYDSSNEGECLTVNDQGELEWAEAGGGGLPSTSSLDENVGYVLAFHSSDAEWSPAPVFNASADDGFYTVQVNSGAAEFVLGAPSIQNLSDGTYNLVILNGEATWEEVQ